MVDVVSDRKQETDRTTDGPVGYCKHCSETRKYLRRGLCFKCYRGSAKVRGQYRTTMARVRAKGLRMATDFGDGPLPQPTEAPPKTEAKILVMVQRLARHESLCHPADAGNIAEKIAIVAERYARREQLFHSLNACSAKGE